MIFEKELEKFKIGFMDILRNEINKMREQIRQEEFKKKENEREQKIKQLERIRLSRGNAELFVKIIKIINEVENASKLPDHAKVTQMAQELNLDLETVQIIVDCVRYSKIFEKFQQAKTQVISYL